MGTPICIRGPPLTISLSLAQTASHTDIQNNPPNTRTARRPYATNRSDPHTLCSHATNNPPYATNGSSPPVLSATVASSKLSISTRACPRKKWALTEVGSNWRAARQSSAASAHWASLSRQSARLVKPTAARGLAPWGGMATGVVWCKMTWKAIDTVLQ